MTNPTLSGRTVDDYLGDGTRRFFATGYRRVGYRIGPVAVNVRDAGNTTVDTHVRLRYPDDWSMKSGHTDLRPHLSTVDAIVLGVQLAELTLVATFRPAESAHRSMWIRAVHIRAGQTPQEDLSRLPMTARLTGTEPKPPSGLRTGTSEVDAVRMISTVACRIGSMRVVCEVVHDGGPAYPGRNRYPGPDALLGPAAERYYGTGFNTAAHRVDDLILDPARSAATARVRLGEAVARRGLESHLPGGPTMIDAFVTGLQLGQILLYELDGVRRGQSSTLWMRSTTLTAPEPPRAGGELVLNTELLAAALVEMNGGIWRTADIVAELGDVRFSCAVAHALPPAV